MQGVYGQKFIPPVRNMMVQRYNAKVFLNDKCKIGALLNNLMNLYDREKNNLV